MWRMVGQKQTPLESRLISASLKAFPKKFTTVVGASGSLLILVKWFSLLQNCHLHFFVVGTVLLQFGDLQWAHGLSLEFPNRKTASRQFLVTHESLDPTPMAYIPTTTQCQLNLSAYSRIAREDSHYQFVTTCLSKAKPSHEVLQYTFTPVCPKHLAGSPLPVFIKNGHKLLDGQLMGSWQP